MMMQMFLRREIRRKAGVLEVINTIEVDCGDQW